MLKKYIIAFGLVFSIILSGGYSIAQNQTNTAKPKTQKNIAQEKPINTTSLEIVNNPSKYLGKRVKLQATFDKFSTLGLDYKKAMRPSTKYIGILIQRDDITDHNIPLSEMKLFMKNVKDVK